MFYYLLQNLFSELLYVETFETVSVSASLITKLNNSKMPLSDSVVPSLQQSTRKESYKSLCFFVTSNSEQQILKFLFQNNLSAMSTRVFYLTL